MRQNFLSLVCALLLTSGHSKIFGGSATWTTGSGDWDISGNWTTGGPPNGIGETATFGDTGTTFPTETVTIDTGYATVGAFVFNITTGAPFSFVQKNAGGLTLDNGGGGATINVTGQQGVDFGLPITLSDDLTINVSGNVSGSVKLSSLSGAQNVTVDNLGINSVSFCSASYTGTTSLLSGILNLSGAASLVQCSFNF